MVSKIFKKNISPRRRRGAEFFFFASLRLCGLLISLQTHAQSQEFSLNSDSTIHWQFRKAGETEWHDATVPGCVHTDLLANKLIPDPFYRDNETKVQWVENEDWEYQTFFNCSEEFLQNKHIEIQFDGLDTYADVYLNDSLILQANNMFRKWTIDVKRFIKPNSNHLFIHFYSAVKKGKELAAQLPYKLPGDEGGKAFERKAQYQFGWDWGPRLVTSGVWKGVKVVGWGDYIINESKLTLLKISKDTSIFQLKVLYSGSPAYFSLTFKEVDSSYDGNPSAQNHKAFYFLEKYADEGIQLTLSIPKPKFWSTQDPFAYHAQLILGFYINDSTVDDEEYNDEFDLAIRGLQLIQQPDSLGSSFYFQLNGQPLFIKGANIIPPDNFLPRVTTEDYKRLVDDAVACHMNMLRVWGGGAYLPDEFYDYCDEKGMLIWQDFMFAGAMVPGDSAFVANVKQEAIDQVIRLRNHPCIALWCGNNEINEAWNNWGFQDENKSKPGVNEKIWNDYQRIFDTILPQVVHEYDPGRFYWESSPKFGWGHKESFEQGDSHYWGVWWGKEPFSSYENHVGRFMSEYGFQSLPSMDCFYEFASPDDWKKIPLDKKTASTVLNIHQKHSSGYEIINDYMKRDYKVPENFEKYVYVSQLVQRDGMATAIEAHRRARSPDGSGCMGTLYWQLNDCWPVTSWSSEDYDGKWKAFQYALQSDLYKTFLISMKEENDSVSVYVVSDSSKDLNARLRIELLSFDGKEKISILDSIVHLDANTSKLITTLRPYRFPKPIRSLNYRMGNFLHAELSQDEELIAEKNFLFAKPKDLSLPNPNLKSEIQYSRMKSPYENYPNVYLVTLHADAFAKDVFLSYDFEDVKFSDNFFDMLPGQEKTVIMYSKEAIDQVNLPVKVISLRDAY